MAGELKAIPAARESPDRHLDHPAQLGDTPLPDTVDLRRDWLPVFDQGHTASCVGWAVTGVLRYHLVTAGQLAPDQPLSPRYVWTAAKEMFQREDFPSTFLREDGTSLKAGLDVVRRFGAVLESELPWETGLAAGPPEQFNASARRRRILSYVALAGPDQWRRWLHESGPVLVLVQKDSKLDAGTLDEFDDGSVTGSHAAALFGYGPDHFLLRSSWGTGWGEQGYARMSLDYAAKAVIESYGVIT